MDTVATANTKKATATKETDLLSFRRPSPEDGLEVHGLIKRCPPLDENSLYCNLLQCTHFSATSIAAFLPNKVGETEEMVGFISGYIEPDQQNTLFIWQVAVSSEARGMGLAGQMLHKLLQRPVCRSISYLETTITPDNKASWALFHKLAKTLNAECSDTCLYERDTHFGGSHDDEMLLRIGPIESPVL